MIVVVGTPAWQLAEPARPAGLTCEIALAAAEGGASVELVGRTGDDPASDALVLALAQAGVGHVALLRDPARPTRLDAGRVADPDPETPTVHDRGRPLGTDPAAGPVDGGEWAPAGLEPADVGLGLQYLTSFEVLVVSDDVPAEVVPVCVDAATYAGAQLVVVLPAGVGMPAGLPPEATVLETPEHGEPAFARLIGRYAAGLAGGTEPGAAFDDAVREAGWAPRDPLP
jgi:hypothetical protein